jgi:CHAT domain-containing protein
VVILEYFLEDDAIHVWIIEHNQINHVSVPIPYEQVIKKVLAFRSEIIWYESDDIYPLLRELYTWLIAPLDSYLADKTTVGIVPFQVLHFVPFSALITSSPDSPRKEGKLSLQTGERGEDEIPDYLIETYAMFALPSLSMLPVVRDRSLQNTENNPVHPRYYFLGIGNATDDLPGANEEIQSITNHFPDSKGYTGSEATKQRLLEEAGNYDIVHLATHGVYDKQHPMFSYLEFSPDSQLYAREIFGLPLGANLVTLSGCETLLPQQVDAEDIHALVSGDELVGFIQAFMYAGTPSVLSSLWRVSDTATQYLMSAFYQNLPRIGKVKSLQQACQSVIRSTIRIGRRKKRDMRLIHPFFWSSFVLIGDWK